jgi:hypothetical protein
MFLCMSANLIHSCLWQPVKSGQTFIRIFTHKINKQKIHFYILRIKMYSFETFTLNAAFIIWSVIAFVATFIYVSTEIQLYRHRKVFPFNSSYFTLWRNLGLADNCVIFYSWFWYRLPSVGLFPAVFINILPLRAQMLFAGDTTVILTYLLHAETVGTVYLCVNRWTSLMWPLRHKTVRIFINNLIYLQNSLQLWHEKRMKLVLISQWCIPLLTIGWSFVVQIIYWIFDLQIDFDVLLVNFLK